MKEIELSKGKIAIIDDEDYEYISQYKWSYGGKGYEDGGYAVRRTSGKMLRMHRVILERKLGHSINGFVCDHINHNTLDNRRENLRLATDRENGMNRRQQSNNRYSRYKGVCMQTQKHRKADSKRWLATIGINGNRIFIGSFVSEKEAALAYNEKAKELFGEFAVLNEIDDSTPDNTLECRKTKPVICETTGQIFESASEASRQTGTNVSNLVQCCRGNKNFKHAGSLNGIHLKWSYYKEGA